MPHAVAKSLCVIFYFGLLVQAVVAQEAPKEPSFDMVAPEPGSTELVMHGQPADVNSWPATLIFTSSKGRCTATVVGPRVVITAAHCIDDGATGRVALGGSAVVIDCDHHPGYQQDRRLDVALCLTRGQDIKLVRGSKRYETLNSRPTVPKKKDIITLLGYGCVAGVEGDNPSKTLYYGNAPVSAFDGIYITTESKDSAAVCYGDSGGGAFLTVGDRRRMVGVNSKGNIMHRSRLTNVASPAVAQFLSEWVEERVSKGASICGLDGAGGAKCAP